jgi:hypothetical protein
MQRLLGFAPLAGAIAVHLWWDSFDLGGWESIVRDALIGGMLVLALWLFWPALVDRLLFGKRPS